MYENSMASYHKDLIKVTIAHGKNLVGVKNGNKKDTKLTHVWNSMAFQLNHKYLL
jgi:hypothetical protein